MIESLYVGARNVHLIFGTVALATFWLQLIRRKGGGAHRRWGQVYGWAMVGVLLSSLPMIAIGLQRGQTVIGLFLGFLTLITFGAGVDALRASRNRTSGAWMRDVWTKLTTALIGAYSVLLVVLYLQTEALLLLVMALVGFAGVAEAFVKMKPGRPYVWWVEHVNGTLATGIAVHVAFLSFGLRGLFGVGGFNVWTFLTPIVGAQIASAYFRRRFAGGAAKAKEKASSKGVVV